MASVNKVILVGKLGRDPELRSTPSGSQVCTLSLATSEIWNDNGNRQERTEWHRVVVWGKQAENCAKYLAKGRAAYIEGRLQTRSWDDSNGVKKYATDIVATTVQFLGGSAQGDQSKYHAADSSVEAMEIPDADHSGGSSNSFGGTMSLDDMPY